METTKTSKLFIEKKEKIMDVLEKVRKGESTDHKIYFDYLELEVGLLVEQQKDVSYELGLILAYLEAMEKDRNIFLEEPRTEEYEGQEVIWPTTLSLWKQDMEEIIDHAKSSESIVAKM